MRVTDSDLHILPWTRETGPSINPIPAKTYTAVNVPLGPSAKALLVTNTSDQDGGADLVTCKRPIPVSPNGAPLKYCRLAMKMFISSIDALNLGRLETDVKICVEKAPNSSTKIRNVANGSTQANLSSGFWQIDGDPPGWLNTMLKPVIPVDRWFDYYHDVKFDQIAKTFSVLGCSFDGKPYVTPSTMLSVAFQSTNWGDLVAAIQLQVMVLKAGVLNVAYDLITLTWSDQPIS